MQLQYKLQKKDVPLYCILDEWVLIDITDHTERSPDLKISPYWVIYKTWLQKQNLTKKITFDKLHCFITFYIIVLTHQFISMSIFL